MRTQTSSRRLFAFSVVALTWAFASVSNAAARSSSAKSFYCIAVPTTTGPQVPGVPGYGHGFSTNASQLDAIESCQQKSPFHSGANCRISACYAE